MTEYTKRELRVIITIAKNSKEFSYVYITTIFRN